MSKKVNSENGETPNDDEDKVTSKDDKSDSIDLDWIFDKGWLRTKK
jgi:hypothetical protein